MATRIGPYRLVRLIQEGGQGRVYLACDDRLHRKVAIKVSPLPQQPEARRVCLEEARLAARMDSPRVVKIYDVIESHTHIAVVMEYVPGCTLEEFLSKAHPSVASTVRVGEDIALALAQAHQQGVIHGDVKASNILLAPDGHAKLADFGISRRLDPRFSVTGSGGSLSAISPEHHLGDPIDHRSDLFALGLILYTMLVGAHPFYRDGQLDAGALLEEELRPLSQLVDTDSVPGSLLRIVETLLRMYPTERIDTALRVRQVLLGISRELSAEYGGSLLREASPYFRHDYTGGAPRQIPGGFGKKALSLAAGSAGERGLHWPSMKAGYRWPRAVYRWLRAVYRWPRAVCNWPRAVAAGAIAVLFTAPVALAFYYGDAYGDKAVRPDAPDLIEGPAVAAGRQIFSPTAKPLRPGGASSK